MTDIRLNEHYHDRGIVKYNGFYTSEHTAILQSNKQKRSKINQQLRQMTPEEISIIIENAILKQQYLSIQLESVDEDGHYYDNIVGVVVGHDDLGIYLSNEKVDYDEIRHVDIVNRKKWSEVIA